jgi:oligopeptide transport system substrate-binding protein
MVTHAQGDNVLRVAIMGQDDVPTLDPSLAEDTSAIKALRMLMPGLTYLNESTVAVEPGLAESWSSVVNDDGTVTYTFTIMPEVPWVRYNAETGEVEQVTDADGNVRYVTAGDFAYGMTRSLTPTTLSYYGNVLAKWIVGGQAMLDTAQRDADGNVTGVDQAAYDAAVAGLGIRAVDAVTLEIDAPGEQSFLTNIYGMWMAVAQPSWVIDEVGDGWFEPETMQSYGPFALETWAHDESISFIKNPFWTGTEYIPAPQIDGVINYFLEQPAALANWEAGELDYTEPINAADLDRVRVEHAENFIVAPEPCTYGWGFNTEKAPFDNVHARRAFSLAVDREDIVTNVTKGGQIPAAFFTLPVVVAAPQQANYPEAMQLVAPDEERIALAQAEWQLYLDEAGGEVPEINYATNDNATHIAIAEATQQMFADVLGVEVGLQTLEWATFLDLRENDAPQMFRAAWCYDYPDANNWTYDVYRSDAGSASDGGNEINWVNETFDELITTAQTEPDVATRTDLYGQAEVILVWEDAVYLPIYYYSRTQLVADGVTGPVTLIGQDSFEKWTISR